MYAELTSWSNLLLAYRKAAKGKRGKAAAATFEYRLEDNLCHLQAQLRSERYRPGPYYSFFIHEPKRRLISAAPFRDRVVHHALCNLIEPIFEQGFIEDSYANRPGKGTHRALDRCQQFARRCPYVLQCDIRQCFPSIDHGLLRGILWRKVSDAQVRRLIDQILAGGENVLSDEYEMVWFQGDDLLAAIRPRGLPIGNLTSQFWANCYFTPFDHFVKRELRCRAYLRFVDDFMLFSESKAQLWAWRAAIVDRLARLRLTIHPQAQPHRCSKGISFLGFRVFAGQRRLKRRKVIFFRRHLHTLVTAYAGGLLSLADLDASVRGWVNHARYGNTVGLRKAVLGQVVLPKISSCGHTL